MAVLEEIFDRLILADSVEKLFRQRDNHYLKNTDFIVCFVIDEHSSVDGLKTPELLIRMVQKLFFNRIGRPEPVR